MIDYSEILNGVQSPQSTATPGVPGLQDARATTPAPAEVYSKALLSVLAIAALVHDFGKATREFQARLLGHKPADTKNVYRHEWVSLRIFQAFVGRCDTDMDWLERLAAIGQGPCDETPWLQVHAAEDRNEHEVARAGAGLIRDGLDARSTDWHFNPFYTMPDLAKAIGWLVFTHHRLPCLPVQKDLARRGDEDAESGSPHLGFGAMPPLLEKHHIHDLMQQINANWNEPQGHACSEQELLDCWSFDQPSPAANPAWCAQVARHAQVLLQCMSEHNALDQILGNPHAMHVLRMSLMLGDHHYSRQTLDDRAQGRQPAPARTPYLQPQSSVYANVEIDRRGKRWENQTLDEHLLGVDACSRALLQSLAGMKSRLPGLKNVQALQFRTENPRFTWQNTAADLAAARAGECAQHGAFIINMASTGYGKTLANAKIMNAIANPQTGMRCVFAIGLRTLTLQTGKSFTKDLKLTDTQCAIHVGGSASRQLFDYHETMASRTGSASVQDLVEEESEVFTAPWPELPPGAMHPVFTMLGDDAKAKSLLACPVVTCTIDHITPATESLRGGRQIAPMLRLMSSDLVIDEPDDFDMADMPALSRLVYWAGMLGSRVLLSSATLPPDMCTGLFLAYKAGRQVFEAHRGGLVNLAEGRDALETTVQCLWVDEFSAHESLCTSMRTFQSQHQRFVASRIAQLELVAPQRMAAVVDTPLAGKGRTPQGSIRSQYAALLLKSAMQLHVAPQNHVIDPRSQKKISFGLIRMANIDSIFDVAKALYAMKPQAKFRVHLCVYHSRFPLIMRSEMESRLDTWLSRRPIPGTSTDAALLQPQIMELVDQFPEENQLFIVLGSPITEVGRDHDYDWAVVEPSSMRSLVQLAGRVRRHRPLEAGVKSPNMVIMDENLRHLERSSKHDMKGPFFSKPGFEMRKTAEGSDFSLDTHSLTELLASLRHPDKPSKYLAIDAKPRIHRNTRAVSGRDMALLEHERMHDSMIIKVEGLEGLTGPGELKFDARAMWGHENEDHRPSLTGVLPQYQRFRHSEDEQVDVAFIPVDGRMVLHTVHESRKDGAVHYQIAPVEMLKLHRISDESLFQAKDPWIQPWMELDMQKLVLRLAQYRYHSSAQGFLEKVAMQFASASLPPLKDGEVWEYSDHLGFRKKKF